jgi:signal transduction histidine kinase
MKPLRRRMRAPGNLTAVFLAVAGISVITLAWLGAEIVRRDRALEIQRLDERREATAGRLVASLERALATDERLLAGRVASNSVPPEGGAVLVVADSSGLVARPERGLLFAPVAPPLPEAPADVFREADALEYTGLDPARVISDLRRLAQSRDPAIKAGAQLRLARNLRKAGRREAALGVYRDLSTVTGVGLSGVPADLVARSARCDLLEQLGLDDRRRSEAKGLAEDLRNGRWQLDRAAWHHYAGKTQHWLGQPRDDDAERRAIADAVEWLWRRWKTGALVEVGSSGRRTLDSETSPVAILWRASDGRLAALVAGLRYQQQHWVEPALAALERPGVGFAILDERERVVHGAAPLAGQPQTRRPASATGLPWTVVAVTIDLAGELQAFTQRRRLVVTGLVAVGLLVVAAGYLIGRAVSRELAVARLQSDFVSAVSHEFRTPLTSLAQFTEILAEDEDAPVEKRRAFHEAQARATRRLTRLVESLLDFGRMEAGARPYKREPIDVAEMTEGVVRDFRQDVTAGGFTVSYNGPAGRAIVNADREALTQAIWNLLDNAVKYSGDSRLVRVEVEQAGEVMIRVRDEGYGIPASESRRIFRKFVRGSAAAAHDVKGTGIGLAMVKHIVDAHAGRVVIDSEPGPGSTFTIILPEGG